jgi:hypothetical protein
VVMAGESPGKGSKVNDHMGARLAALKASIR